MKKISIVAAFAALFAAATLGFASAGELPKGGFQFDCRSTAEPSIKILGRPCAITAEFAVVKGDRLSAFVPASATAAEEILTHPVSARFGDPILPEVVPNPPMRPVSTGFLGGLPLFSLVPEPITYTVINPAEMPDCFASGNGDFICLGGFVRYLHPPVQMR